MNAALMRGVRIAVRCCAVFTRYGRDQHAHNSCGRALATRPPAHPQPPHLQPAHPHRTPAIIPSAALLLALAACDGLPGRPTEAERPLRPAEVVDFATLYGTNCAGCHGADGRLGPARPLNDVVYLGAVGPERLRRITADGVPGSLMPGFGPAAGGNLTEQQIEIVVSGMIARWGGVAVPQDGGVPSYAGTEPGDPERGESVFAVSCSGCHGRDGRGGPEGGSVVDKAYLALVSDQALRSAVIFGRLDLGMPDWRGGARPLGEHDVADVVAWLVAQR